MGANFPKNLNDNLYLTFAHSLDNKEGKIILIKPFLFEGG